GGTITAAVIIINRANRDIEPVPPMQKSDADRLFDALAKPLVKLDVSVSPDVPMHLGRHFVPGSLLLVPAGGGKRMHEGCLSFSFPGAGDANALDPSDQPGQAGQITNSRGKINVKAPSFFFPGNMTANSRVYIKGGIGYSILAPMNGGMGCKHVEFDGTHLLMPKMFAPKIETTEATAADRASLHNRDLIQKSVWSYDTTEYVIYCRPG